MTSPLPRNSSLIHYTQSPELVSSILKHGFLSIPNKRHLINNFLPHADFSTKEPQENGMICFSQLPAEYSHSHRSKFGEFGIQVSWEWAKERGVDRVIYVGNGVLYETFEWLFRLAHQDFERLGKFGDSETNKNVASITNQLYANLLNLYEFMEPGENSDQQEWRIVNSLPMHYDNKGRAELINEILEKSQIWWDGMFSEKVSSTNVEAFYCSETSKNDLYQALPNSFKAIPIVTFKDDGSVDANNFENNHHSGNNTTDAPASPQAPQSKNRIEILPTCVNTLGVRGYADRVYEYAGINIQYVNAQEELHELPMNFDSAMNLAGYLVGISQSPEFKELFAMYMERNIPKNTKS